jgi:hypothetical protein
MDKPGWNPWEWLRSVFMTVLAVTSMLPQFGNAPPASAQSVASCDSRSVQFSGKTSPAGANIRSGPGTNYQIVGSLPANTAVQFVGYAYSTQPVADYWTGKPDYRFYRLSNGGFVASALIYGNAPGSTPTCSGSSSNPTPNIGQPNFGANEYRGGNIFWNAGFAPASTNPPNPRLGSALGNCTWYASGRAKQLGRNSARVDRLSGDAGAWSRQAAAAGIVTSNVPQVGAIAQWDVSSSMPYGHVAVVERVNGDGSIFISESSFGSGTWNFLYRPRTIAANSPSRYILP